jgi:hypothetical protein
MVNLKQVYVLLALFFSLELNAQSVVNFSLKSDGTFLTEEGKSYAIVEFEGKTAKDLYDMVKANVLTLYNSPQNVLNEIESKNITVRALSDVLYSTYKLGSAFTEYRVMYTLVFQFKDGKIRINAPEIDRNLEVRASAVPIPKTFVSLIDDWYDSKWVVKKKKQEKVTKIESQFNYPINYLIGNFSKQSNDTETEDW